MSAEVIQVDDANVKVALAKFRLSLAQKDELMFQIGAAMLVSVRRTFREQGSPARSWAPLAPSTVKSNPKKYGSGHQLLIDSGHLLNSIGFKTEPGAVVIGTNLKYAAVHQFGSRDRGSVGVGPRTQAMQDATVNVKEHSYARLSASLGKGKIGNRSLNVRGPRNQVKINVAGHTRHQNIPARPYLVFRPEDPQRIQSLVNGYIRRARSAAGLGGE
jgi:phage virion morphogenesis protein